MDQLYYELVHNLVIETTRLGIEVKNLKMQVESQTGRLEFNERRARALESVVVYKPTDEEREAQAPAPPPVSASVPFATAAGAAATTGFTGPVQGSQVPGFSGSRVPGSQGSTVPGFHGSLGAGFLAGRKAPDSGSRRATARGVAAGRRTAGDRDHGRGRRARVPGSWFLGSGFGSRFRGSGGSRMVPGFEDAPEHHDEWSGTAAEHDDAGGPDDQGGRDDSEQ